MLILVVVFSCATWPSEPTTSTVGGQRLPAPLTLLAERLEDTNSSLLISVPLRSALSEMLSVAVP